MKLCHCGQPLHYKNPAVERLVERVIAQRGETINVRADGRSFRVPRHYIALHGLKGAEVAQLGFEEVPPICILCEEPVLPAEAAEVRIQGPVHIECAVRAFAGSAAHQLGDCTCCGGTRHDPPGLTRREAAKLAYETFQLLQRDRP